MSTYWGLYCKTHQTRSEHGYKVRQWLDPYIKLRKAFQQFYNVYDALPVGERPIDFNMEAEWFESDNGVGLIRWIAKHADCELTYHNEYNYHETIKETVNMLTDEDEFAEKVEKYASEIEEEPDHE